MLMSPEVRTVLEHTPQPRDLFERIVPVALPMATRFRGITVRETCLVLGPAGWAEFAPFVEYGTVEASRWLLAAIESAALPFPAPRRPGPVPINATIPAVPAPQVPRIAARFPGVSAVKIKIAERGIASLDEDLERIAAVRQALPDAHVRCDANGAYSDDDAKTALTALARTGPLQYVEQPVAEVEGLARLREWASIARVPVPIAADESIRKVSDPLRVSSLGAADVIVVKTQPLGGIRAAASVIEAAGLPAVVSSGLESSVGLAAGVALAAHLPVPEAAAASLGEPPAAGLGTAALLSGDVADPALLPRDGVLPWGRVVPDAALLETYAAGPERARFWTERLEACWAHLKDGAADTAAE
ncbi:MAG TPA: o-succinylbenzoate synthase [Brevibacterium senegalense]|uniref:o-succinylbenzoate synthase n=1 Tax=Brevibacterium senegalense TaxID=1033736 RepID=A0A921MDX2_9MICO|nr:o-succinylbenzoate synthase [Brevibacterium senegalense]